MEGSEVEETPDLVEGTAKSRRRGDALEAAHGSVSVLDPAMILLLWCARAQISSRSSARRAALGSLQLRI